MKIHALKTGHVVLKQAFLHPAPDLEARWACFFPGHGPTRSRSTSG